MEHTLTFGGELPIPIESGHVVRVPFPMSQEDYDLVLETLKLWKNRIVMAKKPDPKQGDELL